jgi:hypothetical protein
MDSSTKDSKKECKSGVNFMEMLLIFIILYFFFDLLVIDKTVPKTGMLNMFSKK